ncbi:MAG: sigma-70 family RNA polymerase sigma factor [Planctomycetes bacterium]|nr:sigma-70 family RNA polymerase sigma factor [Planctomycetota bacterium]
MSRIPDTADLISQTRSGDERACEALLVRYLPELHAFIRLRMGPRLLARETSEDLVQSVCREVLDDLGDFHYEHERGFKSWLFIQALRKVQDRAKYHSRQKRDVGREVAIDEAQLLSGYASFLTPSRVVSQREDIERLERAFDKLPEDYRDVITWSKLLGLTHAEIGERMGRTETAVRALLYRALVRLGFLLDADQPQDPDGGDDRASDTDAAGR